VLCFSKSIESREFSAEKREILTDVLQHNYQNVKENAAQLKQIELLKNENTFTVTTGHQLCLFTGPLYFIYKILSVVKLAEQLKAKFPDKNFVPIYWMASEDHDFEEINHFYLHNQKFSCSADSVGAVGDITPEIDKMLLDFEQELGKGKIAKELFLLFKKSYTKSNLSQATFSLVHSLMGEYGIVILNPDNKKLKRVFSPFVEAEITRQIGFNLVSKTSASLHKQGYKTQVNPRDINLFYLLPSKGNRVRIEKTESGYKLADNSLEFTPKEIVEDLEKNPERFSPNVILRPLYQEVILPNLCYIGGGGELAYWFELKSYFDAVNIPFPMLLLRNSAVVITEKQSKQLDKLFITKEELFLKQQDLVNKKITEHSDVIIDFSEQRNQIDVHFETLEKIAAQTDKSFIGAVKAQKQKQLNGLDNLEKRLLKAERRKYNDLTERIKQVQDSIFPKQSLQERNTNFSELYLEYGADLIPKLKEALKPLALEFTIVEM